MKWLFAFLLIGAAICWIASEMDSQNFNKLQYSPAATSARQAWR